MVNLTGIVLDKPEESGLIEKIDYENEIELNRWHERSVSVDRGPLNFVLKIDENWEKVKNTKDPERYGDYYYEVTPESAWIMD